jgi:hypothetical protein
MESQMINPGGNAASRERGFRGPNLTATAAVSTVLFVAGIAVTAVMTGGGHFPSPFEGADAAASFFRQYGDAIRIAAFLQFGAAIPLAVYTASVAGRLQFLGMRVPGVYIAMFGGFAAAIAQMISALLQWTLSQPSIASDLSTSSALHWLAFALGGPGYVVPFGLLVAGIAVPSAFGRLLPRPMIWWGLGLALVAELSTLVLVLPAAVYLLPIARFSGYAWMINAGIRLPRNRRAAGSRTVMEKEKVVADIDA